MCACILYNKTPEEDVFRKCASPQAEAENSNMEVDGIDHVGVYLSSSFVGFIVVLTKERY